MFSPDKRSQEADHHSSGPLVIDTGDGEFFKKYKLHKSLGVGFASQVFEARRVNGDFKQLSPDLNDAEYDYDLVVKVMSVSE